MSDKELRCRIVRHLEFGNAFPLEGNRNLANSSLVGITTSLETPSRSKGIETSHLGFQKVHSFLFGNAFPLEGNRNLFPLLLWLDSYRLETPSRLKGIETYRMS